MRKPLVMAAAALCLLGPTTASAAQGRGQGHGRGQDEDRGGRERNQPTREEGYARDRAPPPQYRPPPEPRSGPGPRFDPRQAPPASRGLAPGQTMPPTYRGAPLRDFERYRLRPPPPGYDWVQVGRDIYLTQRSTGMVLEAIPGGY